MIRSVSSAYRRAYADLPPKIWMLSIALFVNRFGTMVLPFLTLYLTKSKDYSVASASWMISIYGMGAVIGTYFGGHWSNSVGAVRLQVILQLLSVPLFLVLPFCDSYATLAITIFLLSIVSEGVRPANATAITEFSTLEQRPRSFALQRMALNLGFSFGPAIGGILISYGFFWIFVADAVTTFACACVLLYFFGWHSQDAKPTCHQAKDRGATNIQTSIRLPRQDFEFLCFLGLILVSAIVFFQFHSTYPLYLTDHYGLNEFQIGFLFAVNTVLIVVFEMILVQYARRWRLVLTIGWGCFLTCLGFGVLPFSNALWLCVFSMLILTAGEMLAMPLASSWVSDRSEGGNTGVYMGWYATTYSVAFIIGPALGGVLYQVNKDLVFHLSTVLGILVLGGFVALHSRLHSQTDSFQSSANKTSDVAQS